MDFSFVNLLVETQLELLLLIQEISFLSLSDLKLLHLLSEHLHISGEALYCSLHILLAHILVLLHLLISGHQLLIKLGSQTLQLVLD